MKNKEALKILSSLHDGVDPFTGEVFNDDSTYNHPQIIRALSCAVNIMQSQVKQDKRKENLPERAGKPRTEQEANELAKSYEEKVLIKELAAKHKRTEGAIDSQLFKMGLIETKPFCK